MVLNFGYATCNLQIWISRRYTRDTLPPKEWKKGKRKVGLGGSPHTHTKHFRFGCQNVITFAFVWAASLTPDRPPFPLRFLFLFRPSPRVSSRGLSHFQVVARNQFFFIFFLFCKNNIYKMCRQAEIKVKVMRQSKFFAVNCMRRFIWFLFVFCIIFLNAFCTNVNVVTNNVWDHFECDFVHTLDTYMYVQMYNIV